MNQELDPQGQAGEPAPAGQGNEPAVTPAEPAWYTELGFNDEAAAIESARHAQAKITSLSREKKDLERAQAQAAQPQPQAQPQVTEVTADQFFENPAAAMRTASKAAASEALQEWDQRQQNDRMIDEAAREHNVDRNDLQDMFDDLNNDPVKAVRYLAAMAEMQGSKVNASDIKAAIQQGDNNKAAATQTTGGTHVPESGEPDWDSLSYEDAMKEMARRGMIDAQKGGFTVN